MKALLANRYRLATVSRSGSPAITARISSVVKPYPCVRARGLTILKRYRIGDAPDKLLLLL